MTEAPTRLADCVASFDAARDEVVDGMVEMCLHLVGAFPVQAGASKETAHESTPRPAA
jgi:hypothetical protein